MPDLFELTTALALRLDLLADLIRQREEIAEQTSRYLLSHGDDLTAERYQELEQHMLEQTISLHEMKAEYNRIIGKKSTSFN